MKRQIVLAAVGMLCSVSDFAGVKTKTYSVPSGCVRTFHMSPGRVLTARGLIDDPTVNAMMKNSVSEQMKSINIGESDNHPDLDVRFMGGNGAGLQVDDLAVGDMALWDIGGPQAVESRTYKTTTLVIAVVDNRSKRTIWAAKCTDKFGDPAKMHERIHKAVSQAFSKFPKNYTCGSE